MPDIADKIKLFELHTNLEGLFGNKVQFCDPGDAGVATATGDAAANTYGVYTEAIAATSQDQWLVGMSCELDVADIYTIEVATGAGGSEVPLVEFKFEPQQADVSLAKRCNPKKVLSGTRVAVRLKTVGGGGDTISNFDMEWERV